MHSNEYLTWLSGETPSIYWHDSAIMSEVEDALRNGARGMTTNPFLVASTLKADMDYWKPMLAQLPSGLSGDEKAQALVGMVVGHFANRLEEYRAEGAYKGYCCAQTNPARPGDSQNMIEQAKFYARCAENVVVKVPATRSGIEAMEECAALGINVAATVSFTVPQVIAAGEAVTRGRARARANGIEPGIGIAVLMVGRLDDYLRDVMNDTRAEATEGDILWAGTAAIKRAYQIFEERGYECALMPAGCRGGYHIAELAGARMVMSIAPKIASSLRPLTQSDFVRKIDEPVAPAIIDRLSRMPEFRKAYEPDGMTADEFITFGSCNRTLDQFVNSGWAILRDIKY